MKRSWNSIIQTVKLLEESLGLLSFVPTSQILTNSQMCLAVRESAATDEVDVTTQFWSLKGCNDTNTAEANQLVFERENSPA